MKPTTRNYCNFTLSSLNGLMLGCLLASNPLLAEDIEIYTGALSGGFEEQIRPNILYVIDTSGSMKSSFYMNPADWRNAGPYDATKTYPGSCDADKVYRKELASAEKPPFNLPLNDDGYPVDYLQKCDTDQYFLLSTLHCKKALDAFETSGWYADYVAEKQEGSHTWLTLNTSRKDNMDVVRECDGDWGVHGHNTHNTTTETYTVDRNYNWTGDLGNSYLARLNGHKNGRQYLLASGNFLNWFYAPPSTRIDLVKAVLTDVISELPPDANVGLMRFDVKDSSVSSDQTDGGMMAKEFVHIGQGTNRQDFIDTIADKLSPGGPTPLAETLLEALYVFAGDKPYFGAASQIETDDGSTVAFPSVPASIDSDGKYISPITASCQQNAIVYFTDGAATADGDAYTGRSYLDGVAGWVGGMDQLPNIGNYLTADCNDACMPYLASYLQNEDINSRVAGKQTVAVHTIGFDPVGSTSSDPPDPDYLRETAENGGGMFRMAYAYSDLKDAFQVITRRAVARNTAFTAPALAVNAFNRTRDENRVYFALFKTALTPGWGGNLKAYQFGIRDGHDEVEILDSKNPPTPAIEPETGVFAHDARSFWTFADDGNNALEGGAAHRLPVTRKLYTWFGDKNRKALVDPDYAFAAYNSANFTDAMLGMTGSESYTRADLINWLSGIDPVTSELRFHMGDPLHSRPVIVTYGDDPSDPEQRLFLTTNDGFLHVIDASNGRETFAFVAPETLKNAKRMYEEDSSQGKAYGLDGAPVLRIEKQDRYAAGIHPGDKVHLYVGMRRGGRNHYAFDVTDPDSPKILWRIQGGDLDEDGSVDANEKFFHLGMTFSTPRLGKIRINGVPKTILVFGGGYDPKQDYPTGSTGDTRDLYAEDDYGNAIYIVDADSGDRLWWASSDTSANLVISDMKNSVPSDVSLVDSDNDGWTDRIYVGDTGGRIFRIDIDESNSGTINATGGMIADLGASTHAAATTPDADTIIQNNRKFFYPPDVVMVKDGSQEYLALAIGSGNRAHPSYPIGADTPVQDMFFVLKDPHVLGRPPNNNYDYGITLNTLYDTTSNDVMSSDEQTRNDAIEEMNDAKGWYIKLPHIGEKVLAEAITFNYRVMFSTFEPLDIDLDTCQARTGIGRLYILDIRNGKPVIRSFDGDENDLTTDDRSMELRRDGIPPAPMIAFPEANDGRPIITVGPELPPVNPGSNMNKSYWYLKDE